MNPLSIWFIWFIRSRILLLKYHGKGLKIGYMTKVENTKLGKYNTFYNNIHVANSKFGDFIYVSNNTVIKNTNIGSFCSIGPNVKIGLGMHPTHFITTFPAFYSTFKQCQITFSDKNYYKEIGNIQIGNDVWIGNGAVIMDDVTIGDGSIIAAGAIVTKNVDPYSIVGGVPARLIRKRFNEMEIRSLLHFKWWEKDFEWLNDNSALFRNPAVFFHMIDTCP